MAREQAEVFELSGPANLTYELASGELHYRGPTRPPQRDLVEVCEVVRPLETPIGKLVTATLRASEDGDTSTVSVLLPQVNLTDEAEEGGCGHVGFTTVAVFTTSRSTIGGPGLVDGAVQTYTEAAMDGVARRAAEDAASPCRFTAVLNLGLPGPDRPQGLLRVEGSCEYGTGGYTVELVRHAPQGSNPRDLLLDLIVTPPPPGAMVSQAFTSYPVVYEEETTSTFDTVTILPDGPFIEVQVIT